MPKKKKQQTFKLPRKINLFHELDISRTSKVPQTKTQISLNMEKTENPRLRHKINIKPCLRQTCQESCSKILHTLRKLEALLNCKDPVYLKKTTKSLLIFVLGGKCPDSCPCCLVGWLDYQCEVEKKLRARLLRQIIMGRCALALPLLICALRVSSLILRHDRIPVDVIYPLAQSLRFLRSCSDTRSLQTPHGEWGAIRKCRYVHIHRYGINYK